jgi:hypothetical protein
MRQTKKPTGLKALTKSKPQLGKQEIKKIQVLLKSGAAEGVSLGLQLLDALTTDKEMRAVPFTPSIFKCIVESWDVSVWHAVAEYLQDHPEALAAFRASVASSFKALSKERQKVFVDKNVGSLSPTLVSVFTGLVYAINARSLSGDWTLFQQLTSLSDATAEVVAAYCRDLILPVTTLSDKAAHLLAAHRDGSLYLRDLTKLSDKAATAIAKTGGNGLDLGGLKSISDNAAASLAKHRGSALDLGGLKSISAIAAAHVARYRGESLCLSGLRSISDAVAINLSGYKGDHLDLSGVVNLSDRAAACLAQYKGELDLTGVQRLSDEAIASLARGRAHCVFLDGLRTISDEAAQALEKRKAYVSLDGLKSLSSTAAEALIRADCWDSACRVEIAFTAPIEVEMIQGKFCSRGRRDVVAAAKSKDFAKFVLYGKSYTVTHGRIGTTGRTVKKSFGDQKAAQRSFGRALCVEHLRWP